MNVKDKTNAAAYWRFKKYGYDIPYLRDEEHFLKDDKHDRRIDDEVNVGTLPIDDLAIWAQTREECYPYYHNLHLYTSCYTLLSENGRTLEYILKLTVNTGIDVRTVVSGIAKYHAPEDIIGKKVCLLVNGYNVIV